LTIPDAGWRRHRAALAVTVVGAALATTWVALPSGVPAMLCYEGIAFGAVALLVAGMLVRKPAPRWPWLAFAAAFFLTAAGDFVWDYTELTGHGPGYSSMLASVAYLASYPLCVVAAVGLLGARSRRRDLTVLTDGFVYGVGAWLALWVPLVTPQLRGGGLGVWDWIPTVAYPPLDVLVIVALWRVGRGDLRFSVPWRLVITGLGAMFVADTLFALFSMPDTGPLARVVNVLWLVPYVAVAAAAVDPDMARLQADPEPRWVPTSHRARLAGIAAALAVPAVLLIAVPQAVAVEPLVVAIATLLLLTGAAIRVMGTISKHRDAEIELAWQASHDPLTGCGNRDALLEHLAVVARRSRHRRIGYSVLFLDLDQFKVVNDSLGHNAGDDLLVEVSDRIRHAVREDDFVARFGGDEFVVVCTTTSDRSEADAVAARILSSFDDPFEVAGTDVHVSASIGIVQPRENADDPETVLRDADLAMYRAKDAGRNRTATFDPELHARAHERLVTEAALRKAVASDELRLVLQPVFELPSLAIRSADALPPGQAEAGRIVGYEALLRWERPGFGLVGPADIVPLAESSDLIVETGAWVARSAARQWHQWRDEGVIDDDVFMSVNVSPRQLRHADTAGMFVDIAAREGVPPHSLVLEVTESALLEPDDVVRSNLATLLAAGFRFGIDDFGTGYSSLAQLKRLRVDFIKIDRMFVDGLGHDPEDESIVRAIITMAHQLGISTIAEGVERSRQLSALIRLGCDAVQGFLTGPPAPADAHPGRVHRDAAAGS
jgi:diguanylate cyclase (GGDEF)-like protein